MNYRPSKMKNLVIKILIFFLPFFFCDYSMAALGGKALTGGWTPITNTADPIVIDIGKFAVDEHNKKDQASLKFVKVVKGEIQVVAGTNYNLTIKAVDGKVKNNYVALVWDKPWQKFRELKSFKGPI